MGMGLDTTEAHLDYIADIAAKAGVTPPADV